MKKMLSIFICSAYLLSMQVCFAASNLYFVKNTQRNTVSDIIDTTFAKNKNYTVTKRNPYIAVSKKNSNDYVLIILQQSSANLFYYFQSSSDKKLKNYSKNKTSYLNNHIIQCTCLPLKIRLKRF